MISLNFSLSSQAGAGADPLLPEPGELDWRGAYQRVLAQEPPPLEPQPFPPPFLPLTRGESALRAGAQLEPIGAVQAAGGLQAQVAAPPAATTTAPRVEAFHTSDPVRPSRESQEPLSPAQPQQSPPPLAVKPLGDTAPASMAPLTPTVTAQRMDALLTQAPVTPSRVWQVELPAAQPGWQLRVEQLQPQAPLRLDLSVPLALQPQARRQLAELDKRLREAGHEVQGTRLSDSPRRRPQRVDEVQS